VKSPSFRTAELKGFTVCDRVFLAGQCRDDCVNCGSVNDGTEHQQQQVQLSADHVDQKSSAETDDVVSSVRDEEVADVDDDEEKIPDWIRCSPADLYFRRVSVIINSYISVVTSP